MRTELGGCFGVYVVGYDVEVYRSACGKIHAETVRPGTGNAGEVTVSDHLIVLFRIVGIVFECEYLYRMDDIGLIYAQCPRRREGSAFRCSAGGLAGKYEGDIGRPSEYCRFRP